MSDKLDFEDVNTFVENDIYDIGKKQKVLMDKNFILDRNKSIIWNEERVKLLNENTKDFNNKFNEGLFDKATNFEDDLIEAIGNEANIDRTQSELIYRYAFEEGHSSGNYEILNYAEELTSIIKNILELEREKH